MGSSGGTTGSQRILTRRSYRRLVVHLRRLLISAATALAVVAGPLQPAAPAATAAVPRAAAPVFEMCDTGVECARIAVPFDHAQPSGSQLSLFVSRRRATDPAARIGALFVNPGGPGAPAFDMVRSADDFLTPEVLARFDVVGVDPRGTERSGLLACGTRGRGGFGVDDPVARARAVYAAFAANCASVAGSSVLRSMDTTTTARDLNAVRLALGEERISFVGFSYGTYLGAVYGSLFPNRTRALALDSAIDPSRFGVSMLLDPLAALERGLQGFLRSCSDGTLPNCRFNDGTDLLAKYDRVRHEAINGDELGPELGAQRFDATIASLVSYPRNGWPVLGRALEEMATGVPATFRPTEADSQSTDDRERAQPVDRFSVSANRAILCRDGILPRSAAAYQQVYNRAPTVAPHFSGLRSDPTALACADWSVPVARRTTLRASAPTLVIGNVYDATTPFPWTRALATRLGARLLTRNGGGHAAADKSACVRDALARFLIDETVPPVGTVCSPDLANPT
jgi:pimeloyl-ACP methyl ester carboxylesterase